MDKGIISNILNRLSPKTLAVLITVSLVFSSVIIGLAVYRGANVSLFGVSITSQETYQIRLNINFDPNIVNPRNPNLKVRGFLKSLDGREIPVSVRYGVDFGGIYVDTKLTDRNATFFVEIQTPQGVWKTNDYSIVQSHLTAFPLKEN